MLQAISIFFLVMNPMSWLKQPVLNRSKSILSNPIIWINTVHTKAKGNLAEERGCEYLRQNGFRIIDRNVYNRFGEIDIIAMRDNVLHFVEVKSAQSYEQAINNITPSKLQKLGRTIQFYLQKKKLNSDYCIDALIVSEQILELIENITL